METGLTHKQYRNSRMGKKKKKKIQGKGKKEGKIKWYERKRKIRGREAKREG